MGNPLSPLLADIFMNELKKQIEKHPIFKQHFLYYFRYVDDIIVCFTGTNRQLKIFTDFINKLHTKIEFTLEMEKTTA